MRIALVTNWKSCSRKYNFTLWTNPVCENGLQPKWGLGGNLKICFRKYNFTFWTNPTVENGLQPKWGLGGWHVGSSSWATVIVGDFFVADMAFWDMYEVNLSQYVAAAMEFSSRIGHCFQISHFLGHWKPNWHSWQLGNLTTHHPAWHVLVGDNSSKRMIMNLVKLMKPSLFSGTISQLFNFGSPKF